MRDKPRGIWVTSTRNKTIPNHLSVAASSGDYFTNINQMMGENVDEKDIEIPVAKIPSIEYCTQKSEKGVNNQQKQTAMKNSRTYSYSPTVWHVALWYFQALTNIMTVDVNFYVGGFDLEFSTSDAIIMGISTYMLLKSFSTKRQIYSLPWIIFVFWSMYSCLYLSAIQLKRSNFYSEEYITTAMWTSYSFLLLNIALRFLIWTRVIEYTFGTTVYNVYHFWKNIVEFSNKTLRTVKTVIPMKLNQ